MGESSTTVIAMLPPEKQEKSKIKQTNIFIAFTVAGLPFVISPGKQCMLSIISMDNHMDLSAIWE